MKVHEDVLSVILCTWCNAKDVGNLDISYGNKYQRPVFHSSLRHKSFVIQSPVNFYNTHYMNWLFMRKIKTSSQYLNATQFHHNGIHLVHDIDLSEVTSISIDNHDGNPIPENALIQLINSCPKLKSLEFHDVVNFTDNIVLLLKNSILRQLNELTVADEIESEGFSEVAIDHLSKHCRHLRKLHFLFHEDVFLEQPGLLRLLAHNPQLEHIYFKFGGLYLASYSPDTLVVDIAIHCKQLRYFHVSLYDEVSLIHIAELIRSNAQTLESLHIEYDLLASSPKSYFDESVSCVTYTNDLKAHKKAVKLHGLTSSVDYDYLGFFRIVTDCDEISLTNLAQITVDIFSDIGMRNRGLRVVCVVDCPQADGNEAVSRLQEYCPKLTDITC